MDIKIKKHYYYLRTYPGKKYNVFLREEIMSPMLSVTQLPDKFDNEEDAERFIEKLNEENE